MEMVLTIAVLLFMPGRTYGWAQRQSFLPLTSLVFASSDSLRTVDVAGEARSATEAWLLARPASSPLPRLRSVR